MATSRTDVFQITEGVERQGAIIMVGVADPAQPDQPVLGFAAAGNGERRPLDRAAAPPGRGPRRLRASSRDGGAVVNRPPSPLTMLLSRHTRRREMLTLLTGAAALRPSTARSQPTRRLPRVGFLGATSASGHASRSQLFSPGFGSLVTLMERIFESSSAGPREITIFFRS